MLSLRRLPRAYAVFSKARGNATLEAAGVSTPADSLPPPSPLAEATPSSPPPGSASPTKSNDAQGSVKSNVKAKDSKEKERREWPTRRPPISLERPREWNRPIPRGLLPAFDQALKYIRTDSEDIKAQVISQRVALKQAEHAPEPDEAAIERMRQKLRILEIQSEINLPDVRWKARNGMADMSQTIYRHLVEQRWREEGALDLLMERIHQMNVVPDLLPDLHPCFDLRLNFPEPPPNSVYLRTRVKRRYQKVEPGIFLLPEQTWRTPVLYTTVFHTDPRLYTLVMVDLDVPDPDNQGYTTFLHWMQPNITLSAFSPSPISFSPHTRYIPPHPQQGTPYHRYVVLLLPHDNPAERLNIPVPSDAERVGFNLREFMAQYGLDGAKGGGAHMWREVWDATVSKIYKDVLKTEEPVFGMLPKPDRYEGVKNAKKYHNL